MDGGIRWLPSTTPAPAPAPASNPTGAPVNRIGAGQPPNYCGLSSETGPCRAMYRRYFFNRNTQNCEEFIWGGCMGNSNNFRTRDQCLEVCGVRDGGTFFPPVSTSTTTLAPGLAEECYQESSSGTGFGMIARWWFNAKINACQRFTWTGQGGNYNNFASNEECLRYCGPSSTTNKPRDDPRSVQLPEVCRTDCTVGRCSELNLNSTDFSWVSPYLQIFTGLQASCNGNISSVLFIDKYPKYLKTFYLSVWSLDGHINPTTGKIQINPNNLQMTLHSVFPVTTNGSSGWQQFNLTTPVPIQMGQFVALHSYSYETLATELTVPYANEPNPSDTLIMRVDHQYDIRPVVSFFSLYFFFLFRQSPNFICLLFFFIQVGVLPMTIQSSNMVYVDKRRPALMVKVKTGTDDVQLGGV